MISLVPFVAWTFAPDNAKQHPVRVASGMTDRWRLRRIRFADRSDRALGGWVEVCSLTCGRTPVVYNGLGEGHPLLRLSDLDRLRFLTPCPTAVVCELEVRLLASLEPPPVRAGRTLVMVATFDDGGLP